VRARVLVIAKLVLPESEQPRTSATPRSRSQERGHVLEALAVGTTDGLRLAVNVGAMLIVFTAADGDVQRRPRPAREKLLARP